MPDIKDHLISCDKEPIHIPGKIQQHGFLLAVNKQDFSVNYLSENMGALLGADVKTLINADLSLLLKSNIILLRPHHISQLKDFATDEKEIKLIPLNISINNDPYFLLAHKSGDQLVLEFEPALGNSDEELQQLIGASLSEILQGGLINKSLQIAAKKVKQITGYQRVMVYKFWDDGHGEVIAEEKEDWQEPFFGLHYPATDIPKQARALYKINLTRIIADAASTDVSIIAAGEAAAQKPLDLTHSTLRAVSPVHIEYLKNMEVMASFSISLIANNKLWGLIACHNATAKFIDYKAREGARLIGQILSSSIEYKITEEGKDAARHFSNAISELLRQLQSKDSILEALTQPYYNLLSVTNAKGAAIIFDKEIKMIGLTPSEEQVNQLTDWLSKNVQQQIFSTESLQKEYKEAAAYADVCSGLLACELSKEMKEYILWFKPEFLKTINWAGNPIKQERINEKGERRISPRESFAVWTEQVANTSEPWNRNEFAAVIKLREDVLQVINQKANQIRLLNDKLQEAYDELDTFSFTISHDLKTPLSSVKNYTEILLEDSVNLDESEKKMLRRIVMGAEKMNVLIDEVLAYSRIGRKPVIKEKINMKEMIDEIAAELQMAYKHIPFDLEVKELPDIFGDRVMINQVFTNLLSNAIKYSARSNPPTVVLAGEDFPHEVIYSVTDNGIGINMSFGNQIFEIFKRLNNAAEFEGTGVGLSIVKRIIEKHQGKIWYESELGVGTKFYTSFNKQA